MNYTVTKIEAGEYDQFNKRTFFVYIDFYHQFNETYISLQKVLDFYDEENLNFTKGDMEHISEFVTPLIRERVSEIIPDINILLHNRYLKIEKELNNGQ